MGSIQRQPLFGSDLLSITDVHCREPDPACQGEEYVRVPELVFIRAGLFVKHIGKRRIVADPAHTLFFNQDEGYRVSHPCRSGDDCTVLSFRPETVIEVLRLYHPAAGNRGSLFPASHTAIDPHVLWGYHHLRRGLRAGWMTRLEAEETGLGLLESSLGGACDARPQPLSVRSRARSRRREIVETVQLRLASLPGAEHSLSELARGVGCSPFYLTRLFRQELGVPVHRYLIRLRLAAALERLGEGAENLSALAFELGFSSHSHLTRVFRQTFGQVPTVIRQPRPGSTLFTSAARPRSIGSACQPIDSPHA